MRACRGFSRRNGFCRRSAFGVRRSAIGDRLKEAQLAYRRFVSEGRGQPAPWAALANQVLLGDDAFVDRMRSKLEQSNRSLSEVPRALRAGRAKPLADYAAQSNTRDAAIVAAYASGGYSMAEIGRYFGVHYSTASRAVRAAERGS